MIKSKAIQKKKEEKNDRIEPLSSAKKQVCPTGLDIIMQLHVQVSTAGHTEAVPELTIGSIHPFLLKIFLNSPEWAAECHCGKQCLGFIWYIIYTIRPDSRYGGNYTMYKVHSCSDVVWKNSEAEKGAGKNSPVFLLHHQELQ